MERNWVSVLICLLSLTLAACSSAPVLSSTPGKSALFDREIALGTHGANGMPYHAVVHYPKEHALRYPGLIVGVEKSKASTFADARMDNVLVDSPAVTRDVKWLGEKLRDNDGVMFISHVVANGLSANGAGINSPCFLFTVYGRDEMQGNNDRSEIDDVSTCHSGPARGQTSFQGSWTAVSRIHGAVEAELSRKDRAYSHVILIVMGWNTEQIESIQNFNSIVDRLAATAPTPGEFSPLVIGVTWPSQWRSGNFDVLIKAASLFNKANDADELGVGWLGAIVEHGVVPAVHARSQSRPQFLVIGHSFGARATSQAVCRGTLLKNPNGVAREKTQGGVDWLIGLQGAYSLNRFKETGAGQFEVKYPDTCSTASNLMFTASEHDTAARVAGQVLDDGNFAGTLKTFTKIASDGLYSGSLAGITRFATYVADSTGNLTALCGPANDSSSRLRYVDASQAIFYNAFDTGAGAHSDIYRKNTARMIWGIMSQPHSCRAPQATPLAGDKRLP